MVLENNIPSGTPDEIREILEGRLPNYCPDCGYETVPVGEQLNVSRSGFYDHVDSVIRCLGCRNQWRFGNALNQEEGQEHYLHPSGAVSEEDGDRVFSGMRGWCNLHQEQMTKTKTHIIGGRLSRQWKCPECDQACTVISDEHGLDN